MLTDSALQNSIPLAEILDARRLRVIPVDNTPLAKMVAATLTLYIPNPTQAIGQAQPSQSQLWSVTGAASSIFASKRNESEDSYYPEVGGIVKITNKPIEALGYSQHDLVTDEAIEVIAEAVRGHFYVAKNIVVPKIEELVKKANLYLQNAPKSPLLDMEIIFWSPPALLANSSFQNELAGYPNALMPSVTPGPQRVLPNLNGEELTELLKTGSAALDKLITQWISETGIDSISSAVDRVFRSSESLVTILRTQVTSNKDVACNIALTTFLVARKLFENPIEGTEISLKQFNNLMAEYRNFAGNWLSGMVDEFDDVYKHEILVKNVNGKKMTVYGQVYNDWIEKGGENDVLYGNMLESMPVVTVEQINKRASEFKSNWLRFENRVRLAETNKSLEFKLRVLERAFREVVNELTPEEESTFAGKQEAFSLYEQEIKNVTERDLENLYHVGMRLICRTIFVQTNSEEILTSMDNAGRSNTGIDPKEAGAIAAIQYVARWVASQFKVIPA